MLVPIRAAMWPQRAVWNLLTCPEVHISPGLRWGGCIFIPAPFPHNAHFLLPC